MQENKFEIRIAKTNIDFLLSIFVFFYNQLIIIPFNKYFLNRCKNRIIVIKNNLKSY